MSRALRAGGIALFAAYAAATVLHIVYVVAHEPFAFDAWNVAVDTGAQPATPSRFFDYWAFEYTHSNPRVGQAATYLAYKLDGFAEVATPLSYLALTAGVTALGLGRVPWRRRGSGGAASGGPEPGDRRELALWAVAIGCGWFVFPELGRNMFCRAYAANYIYGAAAQIWFLVPLRLAGDRAVSTKTALAYGVAGVVAGACNEHTGPALLALFAAYGWWLHRRGGSLRLLVAGGAGFALGFLALFFAPGQAERYDGLATKVSLPMRAIQRGVVGNVDILRDYVAYAAPLLVVLAILLLRALVRGDAREDLRAPARLVAIALATGAAMAATLFVSPKLGSRFYIVPMGLLLAATLACVDASLLRARSLAPLVAFAAVVSVYAAWRTLPLYKQVAREGEARMAALAATAPGDIFVADAWAQVDETWWYIGDDFRDAKKRELVAKYYGLAGVYFRGYQQNAMLGMSGIRVVPRVWLAGAPCAIEDDAFDTTGTKGFEIAAIHELVRTSVAQLQKRRPNERIERYEVAVEFLGASPPVPRPRILLARWTPRSFEGYTASLVRPGGATTREVRLSPELAKRPFEITVLQPGSEWRALGGTDGAPLRYKPWRTGVYWVLACDAAECWVLAAAKNNG
ncbi:MAG: hypothetical protein KF773_40870 [Deltaproteobacteria bacterium]|nr:hypothetical protein [Deltaproteobacteria bacterium]